MIHAPKHVLVVLLGLAASGCAEPSSPAAAPESAPPATQVHSPAPAAEEAQIGWVWTGGDGEHPSAALAVRPRAGALELVVFATPPRASDDFAHGSVIPMLEYEATDRRAVFLLKRVMPSIAPARTILEFDQPLSGEAVTGYLSVDLADAHKIGLTGDEVAGKRTPLVFKRGPWPTARTWAEATGTPPTPPPDAERKWHGDCLIDVDPKKDYAPVPDTTIEMTTQAKRLLGCRVVERRAGTERVIWELRDFTGTMQSAKGTAIIDGQPHPYEMVSFMQDDGLHVMLADRCKPAHARGVVPRYHATLTY